jgi:hypothetical protein
MSAADRRREREDNYDEIIENFLDENEHREEQIVPKLVQDGRPEGETTVSGGPDPDDLNVDVDNKEGLTGLSFEPIVVTRLGGTLPWETNSKQLQCGKTVTDNNGDNNTRIVYHAVCTKTQFKDLQRMRARPMDVKLVSAAYTGPVAFDQLKFDRVTDANGTIVAEDGYTKEPIYEIQLQSKEDTEQSPEED